MLNYLIANNAYGEPGPIDITFNEIQHIALLSKETKSPIVSSCKGFIYCNAVNQIMKMQRNSGLKESLSNFISEENKDDRQSKQLTIGNLSFYQAYI